MKTISLNPALAFAFVTGMAVVLATNASAGSQHAPGGTGLKFWSDTV